MPSHRKATTPAPGQASVTSNVARLLWAISPKNTNEAARQRAFRRLVLMARGTPSAVLPHWGTLVEYLRSAKPSSKYPAVHLIAALVAADHQRRFERIFPTYFALLDDEALSVAAHVARLAGEIAQARPALQTRITQRLLALDKTHFDAGRRDLIKSYALEAFDKYYEPSPNKAAMHTMAAAMVASTSPRARKAAKAWLKKHGPGPASMG